MARIRAAFRARLWPLPVLAVILAVALGIGLPALDEALDRGVPTPLQVYLFSGGPDAARAVLQAISGSLITVTSLTFSLTVVTLQLASSQFSPRLLRTFTSDGFVHRTLALFLGTFSYSLTVLRSVRSDTSGQTEFVPAIAVTVAFLLALASVVGLVLFLAHLTREIRVETMMKNVHAETAATIERLIPRDPAPQPDFAAPPGGQRISAAVSGFLNSIDSSRLVDAARDAGAVIRIDAWPGESLISGVPFATVWPAQRGPFTDTELRELAKRIGNAVDIGFERTNEQDPAFGFRRLADVAARALSPGTNDPTTAVHVIGHLSSLLCLLVARELRDENATDTDGVVRAILRKPGFEHFLSLAISQSRHYGMQDAEVGLRLLALVDEVSWCDRAGSRTEALRSQLADLQAGIEKHDFAGTEEVALRQRLERVRTALGVPRP